MKTPVDRLLELHARDGYQFKEFAPFTCPLCGERPVHSINPDNSERIVECICCAPFYPRPELTGLSPWEFMPDEKTWRKFVDWKLHLPEEEVDPEEEVKEEE